MSTNKNILGKIPQKIHIKIPKSPLTCDSHFFSLATADPTPLCIDFQPTPGQGPGVHFAEIAGGERKDADAKPEPNNPKPKWEKHIEVNMDSTVINSHHHRKNIEIMKPMYKVVQK